MRYNIRCEKHKTFIGKDGCKICNEVNALRKEIEHLKFIEMMSDITIKGSEGCIIGMQNEISGLKIENQRLKERKQFYKSRIEQLESAEVPEIVKFATKYLTRNEKQIMINLLGSQSMLAVLVDHFNKIPENRKLTIEPLYDYVINICEKVDYLNAEIAKHMAKQIVNKEFENIITDVASVCDFMAGKITKCKTCTAWLDNKAKNRRM